MGKQSWRDGAEFKSTIYFCRWPGLYSQHLGGKLQNIQHPLLTFMGTVHTCGTHTYMLAMHSSHKIILKLLYIYMCTTYMYMCVHNKQIEGWKAILTKSTFSELFPFPPCMLEMWFIYSAEVFLLKYIFKEALDSVQHSLHTSLSLSHFSQELRFAFKSQQVALEMRPSLFNRKCFRNFSLSTATQ